MSRKMKDSGVEWIGEIPEDWKVQNLKSILVERKESNNPIKTDFILSLTNDRGVIPYSEKGDIGNKSKDDLTKYKLAYPSDIVLNSMNVIIGSVGLSKYFGAVSPVYYMLYPRKKKDSIKYYNYIFQTKPFQERLKGYGNGIMTHRLRIPMINLNAAMLPYPAPDKQQKIANFLDKKVSEIDNIISKTKSSIEEYKKYKQSLITETVTKGLNPDVEMKDSGIEWIGEIPKHWETIKIKHVTKLRYEKGPYEASRNVYVGLENIESYSGKYIISESVYSDGVYDSFKKGDILFSRLRPYLTKCLIPSFDGFCTGELLVISHFEGCKKYLFYNMLSPMFISILNSSMYGTKMPRVSWEFMKELLIPMPPIQEQKQIANFLDNKHSKIDNLVIQKETLIKELETYKKSLIYEYVTGKKQVV